MRKDVDDESEGASLFCVCFLAKGVVDLGWIGVFIWGAIETYLHCKFDEF
jgi:hypothetical protein